MTLLAVQQVVTRVLTDPEFRKRFFVEPSSASLEYPLTERELHSLGSLDQIRVDTCAGMLLRDRVRYALLAFPASAQILRPLMDELAPRFAQQFPPVPSEEPRLGREGERFATFALGLLSAGEMGPAYLGDVIVLERAMNRLWHSEEAWRSAQDGAALASRQGVDVAPDEVLRSFPRIGKHVSVLTFDYDVVDIADRLGRGEVPESPPRRSTIMVLTRTVGESGMRRQRVNGRTRDLLSLCDGTRTGQAIADELQNPRTVEALCRLRQSGVVALTASKLTKPEGSST